MRCPSQAPDLRANVRDVFFGEAPELVLDLVTAVDHRRNAAAVFATSHPLLDYALKHGVSRERAGNDPPRAMRFVSGDHSHVWREDPCLVLSVTRKRPGRVLIVSFLIGSC